MLESINQMVEFFSNGTPMTPGASWLLIGFIAVLCLGLTYVIRGLDIFTQLALCNVREAGFKGIWFAARGLEAYAIRKERVVSVVRNKTAKVSDICSEYHYIAHTSDTVNTAEYKIFTVRTDESSEKYLEAKRLAGDNEHVFDEICPPSRVVTYFRLEDKETGEIEHCFIVFAKYDNEVEVENALNEYFEEEYYEELRRTRKSSKRIA